MASPSVALGVPLMDEDHACLEELLDQVSATSDEALPELLLQIESETRAHFRREEELMRVQRVPILDCHSHQHEYFLSRFSEAHEAAQKGDAGSLRVFLSCRLPTLLAEHVQTVDQVTAELLCRVAVCSGEPSYCPA